MNNVPVPLHVKIELRRAHTNSHYFCENWRLLQLDPRYEGRIVLISEGGARIDAFDRASDAYEFKKTLRWPECRCAMLFNVPRVCDESNL